MLILNLETEDFTVTAKEHNSNNISDVLSITVKQRKTKKEIHIRPYTRRRKNI